MKKLVALLLVLCLAFSSVAIAAADEPFVVNACIASEPETIDPSLISSVDGSTYTQHQFENLMKYRRHLLVRRPACHREGLGVLLAAPGGPRHRL